MRTWDGKDTSISVYIYKKTLKSIHNSRKKNYFFSTHWKNREMEVDVQRALLSTGSLPKCPQHPGLDPAKARRPGTHLDLPHVWQGPRCLSDHLLPPRVHKGRELGGI